MYNKRDYLEKNVGNTITVQGKIAVAFWQHMTKFTDTHPNMIYFDLEDGYQIIVYSKNDIACEGIIEITVDSWRCFE